MTHHTYTGSQGEEAWEIHGVTMWAWTPEQRAAIRAFVAWLDDESTGGWNHRMDTRREDLMWHAFQAGFKAVKP